MKKEIRFILASFLGTVLFMIGGVVVVSQVFPVCHHCLEPRAQVRKLAVHCSGFQEAVDMLESEKFRQMIVNVYSDQVTGERICDIVAYK